METVLSISNLTKHFGRIKAVNGLNLEVRRGQVFGMLGPNGSGKTTTLGMLTGVVNPTSGDFSWFGHPPTHQIRKKIGAVLEHPIFYPYLSGQKNLELNAMIKACPPENIPNVLELVELTARKDDKYKTYSLGMKQRLAIASALLNDPTVLILDEPTNGLDPMGIAEIRELIKKIAADGKTIILASHLLDEVQKVCTHFCVLKKATWCIRVRSASQAWVPKSLKYPRRSRTCTRYSRVSTELPPSRGKTEVSRLRWSKVSPARMSTNSFLKKALWPPTWSRKRKVLKNNFSKSSPGLDP